MTSEVESSRVLSPRSLPRDAPPGPVIVRLRTQLHHLLCSIMQERDTSRRACLWKHLCDIILPTKSRLGNVSEGTLVLVFSSSVGSLFVQSLVDEMSHDEGSLAPLHAQIVSLQCASVLSLRPILFTIIRQDRTACLKICQLLWKLLEVVEGQLVLQEWEAGFALVHWTLFLLTRDTFFHNSFSSSQHPCLVGQGEEGDVEMGEKEEDEKKEEKGEAEIHYRGKSTLLLPPLVGYSSRLLSLGGLPRIWETAMSRGYIASLSLTIDILHRTIRQEPKVALRHARNWVPLLILAFLKRGKELREDKGGEEEEEEEEEEEKIDGKERGKGKKRKRNRSNDQTITKQKIVMMNEGNEPIQEEEGEKKKKGNMRKRGQEECLHHHMDLMRPPPLPEKALRLMESTLNNLFRAPPRSLRKRIIGVLGLEPRPLEKSVQRARKEIEGEEEERFERSRWRRTHDRTKESEGKMGPCVPKGSKKTEQNDQLTRESERRERAYRLAHAWHLGIAAPLNFEPSSSSSSSSSSSLSSSSSWSPSFSPNRHGKVHFALRAWRVLTNLIGPEIFCHASTFNALMSLPRRSLVSSQTELRRASLVAWTDLCRQFGIGLKAGLIPLCYHTRFLRALLKPVGRGSGVIFPKIQENRERKGEGAEEEGEGRDERLLEAWYEAFVAVLRGVVLPYLHHHRRHHHLPKSKGNRKIRAEGKQRNVVLWRFRYGMVMLQERDRVFSRQVMNDVTSWITKELEELPVPGKKETEETKHEPRQGEKGEKEAEGRERERERSATFRAALYLYTLYDSQ